MSRLRGIPIIRNLAVAPGVGTRTAPETPASRQTMGLRRVLRDKEPEIEATVWTVTGGVSRSAQAVRDIDPQFPTGPGSLGAIQALDVIEHVEDEEAWLRALADLLVPGGEIVIRVPAEGPVAWLDAPNIYRYVTEFTSRGTAPHETKPTGWHRHYRRDDLLRLVERSGLRATGISRVAVPVADIPHLLGMVVGDFLLDAPNVERRLISARERIDRTDHTLPTGPLGARFRVVATKRS